MRKKELLTQRNEAIVKKFHELYNQQRMRLDDALHLLSESYFLDENYIYSIIFYDKAYNYLYNQLLEQQTKPSIPNRLNREKGVVVNN